MHVVIIIAAIILLIVFLSFFRAEGLMALFLMSEQLAFILVDFLHVQWSTVLTGLMRPLFFVPCMLWWWLGGNKEEGLILPRRINFPVILILLLFVIWESKHFFEVQTISITDKYEYYKWAYMATRWGMAFILGMFMPLTILRLRRALLGMGILGLLLAAFIFISFIMGLEAFESTHYSPSERATGLNVAIYGSIGGACLLAYLHLADEQKKSTIRRVVIGCCVALIWLVDLITSSRGPMAALFLVLIATLVLSGGKNAIRIAIGLGAFSFIIFLGWGLLTEDMKTRLFGRFFGSGGTETRARLFLWSFNILGVAPMLGRTVGVKNIIGIDYSHQITTQVMVELGLIGLFLFLMAFIPTLIRWARHAFRKGTAAQLFAAPLCIWLTYEFVERHVAGELASADFWLLMGILMGHKLAPIWVGPEEMEELEEPESIQVLYANKR